ncbi:unnamed protein product, partial [Medioppia subpectinata]
MEQTIALNGISVTNDSSVESVQQLSGNWNSNSNRVSKSFERIDECDDNWRQNCVRIAIEVTVERLSAHSMSARLYVRRYCCAERSPLETHDMSDSEESNRDSDNEAEEDNREPEVADEEEPEGEDLDAEEEYSEDSDEDEVRGGGRRRGKRSKPRHGGFILDEAEVDDEIEDDEEWEDGADEIIEKNKHLEDSARDQEGHRRIHMMWNSQKEDEIEDYYRRKYAETSAAEKGYDGDVDLPDDITQQALMPGVKDPNLWMIKC